MTDSAINTLSRAADQEPSGLDDLLATVRSDDEEKPKKRGRKKEAPAKAFKAVLWASANKLRAQIDAAEYKHLVLGMIFLKYSSDTFVEQQQKVLATMARELAEMLRRDVTNDWQFKENVRAKLRLKIKTLLKRYKYTPDQQVTAIDLVLQQAETLGEDFVVEAT